jgi:hypothetical protein
MGGVIAIGVIGVAPTSGKWSPSIETQPQYYSQTYNGR